MINLVAVMTFTLNHNLDAVMTSLRYFKRISLENKILKWFNEPKLDISLQRANTYTKVLIRSQLFPKKPFLLFTYAKQNHIHLIISRILNKSDNLKNI